MAINHSDSLATLITDPIVNFDSELWDKAIDNHSSDKQLLYENVKSRSAQLLWRLAKSELTLSYAFIKKNDVEKDKHYVLEALKHSQMALDLDHNSIDCMKWFCASAGRATAFMSGNERIRLGIEIKHYCDKAIASEPNDSMLYFIYGRWCYEVAGLTNFGHFYAKSFPNSSSLKSSNEEALEALKKADQIRPEWKINYLWIAKVFIAKKDFSSASVKIEAAQHLPVLTEEDSVANKELNELQNQYKKKFKQFLIKDDINV